MTSFIYGFIVNSAGGGLLILIIHGIIKLFNESIN